VWPRSFAFAWPASEDLRFVGTLVVCGCGVVVIIGRVGPSLDEDWAGVAVGLDLLEERALLRLGGIACDCGGGV
jgi:hypothetical protein